MKIHQVHPAYMQHIQTLKAASTLLYLRLILLEENSRLLPAIRLAGTDSGGNNASSGKGTTSAGSSGAGQTGGNDDDELSNPGADLVNNTGDDIRLSDFENAGIAGAPKPDPHPDKMEMLEEEEAEAMSPGGTGENRVIGGDTDREIDWNNLMDNGTGEADAATS